MWHLCAYVLGVMDPSGHLVTTATDRRFFPDFGLSVITCPCIINGNLIMVLPDESDLGGISWVSTRYFALTLHSPHSRYYLVSLGCPSNWQREAPNLVLPNRDVNEGIV